MKYFKFLILAFSLLAAGCAARQEALPVAPPGGAAVSVKTKKIQFARPVELDIVLSVPAVFDAEASASPDYAVIEVNKDKKNPLLVRLTVLPFKLDELEFNSLTFIDEAGRAFGPEAFKIKVNPAKTKVKTKGLADIYGPYRPFNKWLIPQALLLGVLAFIICLLYKRYKNRPAAQAALALHLADNRPPHIIALERVDNLLNEGLWQKEEYKIFYIRLVDILRDYLSARFAIDAHSYTSRDLLKRLRRLSAFKGDAQLLARFQQSADLVKFAKVTPSAAERDGDIRAVKTIIEDTRPKEKPPVKEKSPKNEEG